MTQKMIQIFACLRKSKVLSWTSIYWRNCSKNSLNRSWPWHDNECQNHDVQGYYKNINIFLPINWFSLKRQSILSQLEYNFEAMTSMSAFSHQIFIRLLNRIILITLWHRCHAWRDDITSKTPFCVLRAIPPMFQWYQQYLYLIVFCKHIEMFKYLL